MALVLDAPDSTVRAATWVYHRRTTCRACGGTDLHPFLSLGPMPLANAFPRSPADFADEAVYPLDVTFCGTCSLIQIVDVVDPEVLFRDYIYMTGTSETIRAHNLAYAQALVDELGLNRADLVVEAASNDGSLLKCFKAHGVRTLGVEPATNIALLASADGIETVNTFFHSATALTLRATYGRARVVIGNNVLAHVDEPSDFLRGCHDLLTEDGRVVVEVPYLGDLLDRLEYDTIYHEHLCYFSVSALLRLCAAAGLSVVRVDHMPIHGGSLRLHAARQARQPRHAEAVLAWAEAERRAGLTSLDRFTQWAAAVQAQRAALRSLLATLAGEGRSLAAYGAPAKGNTLLNYCGIDTELIPYTVDKSPLKVGRFTPGTHIPVLPVATLLERHPDYVLILAWNFADEIMQQQAEYRRRGGRFILPIPNPRLE